MIARGDGTPLYNFAVAVDDAEMGITDVIRGDDHLSNTPEAAARARGARRRPAALRPPAAAARARTARSSPSATAPPRSRSCATPATCRRRSATTSRCSAGAPTTTRRSSRPPSSSSSSRSSGSGAPRRSSTSASCAGSTAATCASCRSTRTSRRPPRDLERAGHAEAAADRERLAAACAIAQEKAQTLDELWPLIAFPVRAAGRRPEGVVEGDGARRRAPRRSTRRSRSCAAAEPFDPPTLEAELGAAGGAARS